MDETKNTQTTAPSVVNPTAATVPTDTTVPPQPAPGQDVPAQGVVAGSGSTPGVGLGETQPPTPQVKPDPMPTPDTTATPIVPVATPADESNTTV